MFFKVISEDTVLLLLLFCCIHQKQLELMKNNILGMHHNYYTEGTEHHFSSCSENTFIEITENWNVTLQ